jgi:hypothetical chaperone protein
MRLGIDFGTTNSSAAHYDGRTLRPVRLDPNNENPNILPSLIWIDRDHSVRLGSSAATEYLDKETGRRTVWSRQALEAIEIIVAGAVVKGLGDSGPIHYWHDVHIVTDVNANGRLLQSVKTTLRDPRYEGTRIFDRTYTIDRLIALLLTEMRTQAERQFEEPCDSVVLGRPVKFSDDPDVTARSEEILYRAARFAGFREIAFQMEPIAAAHLYNRQATQREIALIFDFGGGTLDLTIVEVGGHQPPRVIATRGALIGGDNLDQRIMRSLWPHFGSKAKVDGGADFPPEFLDRLQTWQTMPELSRPEPLSRIHAYRETSDSPAEMHALETLVTQNIGFKLFQEIERTKKALTQDLMTRLRFAYDNIDLNEPILRRDFEEMIGPEIAEVAANLRAILKDARMKADQVDVVLRTGGTSLVPACVKLLEEVFGQNKVRDMAPLTSVGGGMAIVAHEEAGVAPTYAYRYENPFIYARATSGRHYEPVILRAGMQCYTDQDYQIINLPLALSGFYGIRSANLDYDSDERRLLRFKLNRPSKVYVIYQAKAEDLPLWLRGFQREEALQVDIQTPGGLYPFFVYSRDFPAGAFALGGARAEGYNGIVFLNYIISAVPH